MRIALLLVLVSGCAKSGRSSGGPPGGGGPRSTCGDSVVNGVEACDGTRFAAGDDCLDYGLGAGSAGCANDCTADFSACATSDWCSANGGYGNGLCDACDELGGTADGECTALCGADGACADRFEPLAGVWTCKNAGLTDPDCGTCGNDVLEGNEPCDGTTVLDPCSDYGFVGGTLGCTADCSLDFSGCQTRICGNGQLDPGEECDGELLGGLTCADFGMRSGTVECRSCSPSTSNCLTEDDARVLWTAVCDLLVRCEPQLGPIVASRDFCIEFFTCLLTDIGGSRSDLADCANVYQGISCADVADGELDTVPEGFDACVRVFEGGSADDIAAQGQSCEGRVYCEEGSFCGEPNGRCTLCAPYRGENASCSFDECDPDTLYCEQTSSTCELKKSGNVPCEDSDECASDNCALGYCRDPVPENAACDPDVDECEGNFECIQGVCQWPRRVGQSCVDPGDCVLGAMCEGTCRPISFTCEGGGVTTDCSFGSGPCSGGWCTDSGVCTAFLAPGDECDDYYACGPDAECRFGETTRTCVPYAQEGESCDDADCADELACVGSFGERVCRQPLADGQSCDSGIECQSWYCQDGVCTAGTACVP